jgi:hypothetical protein
MVPVPLSILPTGYTAGSRLMNVYARCDSKWETAFRVGPVGTFTARPPVVTPAEAAIRLIITATRIATSATGWTYTKEYFTDTITTTNQLRKIAGLGPITEQALYDADYVGEHNERRNVFGNQY